ncbi:reverse transcriptase domain-containing protein [Tanacetum coccineum]
MDFGGNTRDLGSIGEETDKTTTLHQSLLKNSVQCLETVLLFLATTSYNARDDVRISKTTLELKYVTFTLLGCALTWWNSHVRTVGHDAAYGMLWKTLMKMMTEAYYPRTEIKKPKMLQEAIELATSLIEQKVRNYAAGQADNKKRMDNNLRDNNVQQLPYKRQDVARAYTVRLSEKKKYAGTLPLCNKCKLHHNGPCTIKCTSCKRVCHITRDCRSPTTAGDQRTLTCYECGNQGHYRSECPRLKNQNCGNQTRNGEARGRVYAMGGGEADQDPNNTTDDIDA